MHLVFWRKVSPGALWGGSEFQLLSYLKALDPHRHRATVVATYDIFSEVFQREGLHVPVVCTGDLRGHGRLRGFLRICQILWNLAPDRLVVIQGSFTDYDVLEMAAQLVGMRGNRGGFVDLQVSSPESALKVSNRSWLAGLLPVGSIAGTVRKLQFSLRGRIPGQVLTVSRGTRQRVVEWFGYPASSTQVMHHGIPLDRFYPSPDSYRQLRTTLGIPVDATVIISTARFSPEKNPEWIADAIERFAQETQVWWLLVGEGPLRPAVQARVNESEASERVLFLGNVDAPWDYLQAADIFILPSSREGLSNAMLEAMATGLITVVTRVAGADDAITHEENGIITEVSSQSVSDGIACALRMSEEDRHIMRDAAMRFVRNNFDRNRGIEAMFKHLGLRNP